MNTDTIEAAKRLIAELVKVLSDMPNPQIDKYVFEASTQRRIGMEHVSIDLGNYRSISLYIHRGFKNEE